MGRVRFSVGAVVVAAIALVGPMAGYAHELFWVHMVQHLLLTLLVAPLFVAGAPLTAVLRMSSGARRRSLARLLRSRLLGVVTHPVVAWMVFAVVMWVTHFSPLYELALQNELVHVAEHGLYLAAAVLFWMPVIGADPISRRRLAHPARLAYLVAALPVQSFLGLALYSSSRPLYAQYPDLSDQRLGALIMWIGGDFVFVVALALSTAAWMRADRLEARRLDRSLAS